MLTIGKTWTPDGSPYGPDGQPGKRTIDDDGNGTVDDASEAHFPGSDDDPNWVASASVAVFFNRSFTANDESSSTIIPLTTASPAATYGNYIYGFDGAPGVSGVDDDNDGQADLPAEAGSSGSDDNRTLAVSTTNSLGNATYLKKGSFLLETSQLRWYRIVNIRTVTTPTTFTMILLDQDLQNPTGLPITNAGITTNMKGVFMKGIVDVYPLGLLNGAQ